MREYITTPPASFTARPWRRPPRPRPRSGTAARASRSGRAARAAGTSTAARASAGTPRACASAPRLPARGARGGARVGKGRAGAGRGSAGVRAGGEARVGRGGRDGRACGGKAAGQQATRTRARGRHAQTLSSSSSVRCFVSGTKKNIIVNASMFIALRAVSARAGRSGGDARVEAERALRGEREHHAREREREDRRPEEARRDRPAHPDLWRGAAVSTPGAREGNGAHRDARAGTPPRCT